MLKYVCVYMYVFLRSSSSSLNVLELCRHSGRTLVAGELVDPGFPARALFSPPGGLRNQPSPPKFQIIAKPALKAPITSISQMEKLRLREKLYL